jgi:hypothetical protein
LRVVEQTKGLMPQERADRLLRYLARSSEYLGQELAFDIGSRMWLGSEDGMLLTWSESLNPDEVRFLFQYLEQQRNIQTTRMVNDRTLAVVTPEGYARLAELDQKTLASSQAFVAMWFSNKTDAAYSDGIEPAIRDAGYRSLRIDRKEHINKIDDEIIAEIRRSRFVVADFTAEVLKRETEGAAPLNERREIYVARDGVYYETGFA